MLIEGFTEIATAQDPSNVLALIVSLGAIAFVAGSILRAKEIMDQHRGMRDVVHRWVPEVPRESSFFQRLLRK